MLTAVLFDLDDTLLDRQASLTSFAWQQGRERLGLRGAAARRFVERFVRLDHRGRRWTKAVYRTLVAEFSLGTWTVEQLLADYERGLPAFCVARDGGALRALEALGMRRGLVSNGKAALQGRKLRAIGNAPLFDARVFPGASLTGRAAECQPRAWLLQ